MKKFVCAAILTLIVSCMIAVSVSAADAPTASLTPKAETAYRGDTVSVEVTLDAPASATIGVQLNWDSAGLEWLGGKWESIPGITLANIQTAYKTASCAISPASDVSGKILTLDFKIKDDAAFGDSKIDATVLVKSNGEQKKIETSATIKIVCKHEFTEQVQSDAFKKNDASCTEKLTYYYSCKCGEKGTETFTVGEMLDHSFTEQVKSDAFKKNDASCQEKLTYYYSCKCGAKGTETFTVGELGAHVYTEKVEKDEYKKNDASCTEKKTYYYSCKCGLKGTETFTVGDTLPHTYSESVQKDEYKKNDASCTEKLTYYKSCKCGAKGTETFTVGEKLAHSYTEKVQKSKFKKSDATCTEKAVYYYSCKCGAKGTETFTAGSAAGHKYKTEWSTNETNHWHECSTCGDKKDNAAHVPGPAATETTDQICTECSYVIAVALGHTHDYPAEWKTNANEHWHECKCGDKKDAGAHVFDNACDTTCNTCTYVRTTTHSYKTEWSTNATHHWYECSSCGDKKDEAAHVAGPEATEESEQICTVCNYVLHEKLDHTHVYDKEWKSDDNQHWHECKCGEKSDLGDHNWNDGTVTVEPTTEKEGVKLYSCRECGALKKEAVKKLEEKKGGCSASTSGSLALISVFLCAQAAVLFKKKKTR